MSEPDQPPADSWAEDDNAVRYDAFARLYPMYRQTSSDLVTLARLGPGASVLDLACGTGVTTTEILTVLGSDGKVIGADKSGAMLTVAARRVPDQRVEWVQAAAEDIDRHVAGPVDAVICNSAIWQTSLPATAAAVHKLLAAEGRFVFNVGAGFLEQHDDPNDQGDLTAVMRAIATRDYGWNPPARSEPQHRRQQLTRESISRSLADSGFETERVEELSYEDSGEAERYWLTIPVFTRHHLPGLPYQDRIRVLDHAYEQLGPAKAVRSRWVAFLAKARQLPSQQPDRSRRPRHEH